MAVTVVWPPSSTASRRHDQADRRAAGGPVGERERGTEDQRGGEHDQVGAAQQDRRQQQAGADPDRPAQRGGRAPPAGLSHRCPPSTGGPAPPAE